VNFVSIISQITSPSKIVASAVGKSFIAFIAFITV
jgi:hypothetical protein